MRHFFRVNDTSVFFVGATPFNLLGLDRWVRNLSYISFYDGWDGAHPRIFTPKNKPARDFESGEDINKFLVAVEAVCTDAGTIGGPFMTELTGYPELTPYHGGWCGNETFPDVLDNETRAVASDMVRRLGDRLGEEDYMGFFEVDVLIDLDTTDVYLGELNSRISGARPWSRRSPRVWLASTKHRAPASTSWTLTGASSTAARR